MFRRDSSSVGPSGAGSECGFTHLCVVYNVLFAYIEEQGCIGGWVSWWVALWQWNRVHFVLVCSPYCCRVIVSQVRVIVWAWIDNGSCGYPWSVFPFLGSYLVDLTSIWSHCLEGIAECVKGCGRKWVWFHSSMCIVQCFICLYGETRMYWL